MITVERNFDMKRIEDYIARRVEERIQEIVEVLRSKGVEYTTLARAKTLADKPYTNRTFNLVSSIGFAIVRQGIVLESYFPLLKTGIEGKIKGEATAEKAAREYSESNDDVSLVFVAGEDYASYVQEKDFDVTLMAATAFATDLRKEWKR